jgi:predicted nucleic acid-binding protein
MTDSPALVLDSFAILAYVQGEAGMKYTGELLIRARRGHVRLYMHEINAGEVYYLLFRRRGEEVANYLYAQMRAYPVEFVTDLSSRFLLTAARLKGLYAISYADAFAVATAHFKHAELVSGDPDLKPLVADRLLRLAWPSP